MKIIVLLVSLITLAGCSTSANMQVGNDQSYLSISEQRAATDTVRVSDELPANAEVIGPVEATRCHRNWTETAPKLETLTRDLQVAAYAAGAEGITDVEVKTHVGAALLKNCWKTITGRATAYNLEAS